MWVTWEMWENTRKITEKTELGESEKDGRENKKSGEKKVWQEEKRDAVISSVISLSCYLSLDFMHTLFQM